MQPQGFNYSRSENVGFVFVCLVLALKNVNVSSELFLTLKTILFLCSIFMSLPYLTGDAVRALHAPTQSYRGKAGIKLQIP